MRQDIYDMLRRADLIWDKSGVKQPRRRKEAKLLAERETDRQTGGLTVQNREFSDSAPEIYAFHFSNDPIQFDFKGHGSNLSIQALVQFPTLTSKVLVGVETFL